MHDTNTNTYTNEKRYKCKCKYKWEMRQIQIEIQMRNETNTNTNMLLFIGYCAPYYRGLTLCSDASARLTGIRYIWNTFKGRKALLAPHCVGNKHFLKGIIWEMMIIIDHWSQLKCFIFVERKPVSDLHLFVSRARTSKSKHPILEWITFRWESSPQ